jgi:glycine hydroxymethyltransferase
VTGGTDLHLMVLRAYQRGLTGVEMVNVIRSVSMNCTYINLVEDPDWTRPGGVRIGTHALTTRGYLEEDIIQAAEFFERAI